MIWLYDVRGARDKFDLLRFDASGAVSSGMFDEDWPRFVVKMATGAGKTKVLSLLMAWSFFHKLYETDSSARAQLPASSPPTSSCSIACAPISTGCGSSSTIRCCRPTVTTGRNWRDDFQITLHIQDDVRIVRPTGNIFLTNIHRVYLGEVPEPSLEDDDLRDYFLTPFGAKPVGKTTDSKIDLGEDRARDRRTRRVQRRGAPHPRPDAWRGSSPSRTSTTGCCRRTSGWRSRWT